MFTYSIIIPVYNRPIEVKELLESLVKQEYTNFRLIIVEDGSSERCDHIVEEYRDRLDIDYYFKENSGPGESRNFGMTKAKGDYLLFFDSDCLIPPQYLKTVDDYLQQNPLDTYGGPDSAHDSFTDIQKAINYSMTSMVTTGGVRGKKSKLDNFQPRSFNMGIKKEVYQKIGGFSDIHPGEDPDLSYRIMDAGYKVGLIEDAYVYHKRRIDFKKFRMQVYKFGVVRTILMKWYPQRFSLVYTFPTVFLLGLIGLLVFSLVFSPYFLIPIFLLIGIIFVEALLKTGKLKIAFLAIPASFIQLLAYGWGFLKGITKVHLLKREERKAFPKLFFKS